MKILTAVIIGLLVGVALDITGVGPWPAGVLIQFGVMLWVLELEHWGRSDPPHNG